MKKKFVKKVLAQSGHNLYIEEIERSELPDIIRNDEYSKSYKKFYTVKNFDSSGVIFLYLGDGYSRAPNQIVAWYRNTGSFWSGFGLTFKKAIDGAQRDGWKYA